MLGIALVLIAISCAGCGKPAESVPAACLSDSRTLVRALQAAPNEVRLDGTPLSECVSDQANGDSLQATGGALVGAAAQLADAAARRPEGGAALQLGYLLGAMERSRRGSQGVGYELERRLRSEAARVPEGSKALSAGRRAGAAGG